MRNHLFDSKCRKIARLGIFVLVVVLGMLLWSGSARAAMTPYVHASVTNNWIAVGGIPSGNIVTVKIYIDDSLEFEGLCGNWTPWNCSPSHPLDLLPGMRIVALDETQGIWGELIIQSLTFDTLNYIENTASGTTTPSTLVRLKIWRNTGSVEITTTSDGLGNWTIDTDSAGIDIVPEDNIRVEQPDEQNDMTIAEAPSAPPVGPYTISGTVRALDTNEPIANAFVAIEDHTTGASIAEVRTNGLGQFAVGVQPGVYQARIGANGYAWDFWHAGYPADYPVNIQQWAGDHTAIDVTNTSQSIEIWLEHGVRVSGYVKDQQGNSLPNIVVIGQIWTGGRTDQSGWYSFDGLYSNRDYELWVACEYGQPCRWVQQRVPLTTADIAEEGLNIIRNFVLVDGGMPTPTGTEVSVTPVDLATGQATVDLTFVSISEPGVTTVTSTDWSETPSPNGLSVGWPPRFYDIHTDAQFTPPVEVCINYAGIWFEGPEDTLEIYHEVDGIWTRITSSRDPATHVICGITDSFSLFAVFSKAGPQPPWIHAFVNTDAISVDRLPVGGPSTIEVYDQTGALIFSGPCEFYSDSSWCAPDLHSLIIRPGMRIVARDDTTGILGAIIVANLTFDWIDYLENQAGGTGPANSTLIMDVANDQGWRNVYIPVGSDGRWFVDTDDSGVDLRPDDYIRVNHPDGPYGMFRDDFTIAMAPRLNSAPVIGAISGAAGPVTINTTIEMLASFTDPDPQDTHTAVWDWGDGTSSAAVVNEAGIASGLHGYALPGVYTVQLTLADTQGASAEAIYTYVVVYDPDAGFITGGGWFNSPIGAYAADPTLTGKANFGFVAKYKQGANIPTGITEFNFRVGNLNFKSTSYDWLVITKHKAQYKGIGTINGEGSYGFMLTVVDGDQLGGGGVDKFRIKIWNLATGQIVYDNQLGAVDDTEASTAIGGGAIVIHNK